MNESYIYMQQPRPIPPEVILQQDQPIPGRQDKSPDLERRNCYQARQCFICVCLFTGFILSASFNIAGIGYLAINFDRYFLKTFAVKNTSVTTHGMKTILFCSSRKHCSPSFCIPGLKAEVIEKPMLTLLYLMSDEYRRYISNNNEQSERLIKGVNLYMDYTETRKGYGFIKWKPSENRSNLKNVYGNTNRSAEFRENAVKINNDGFYSVYISLTYKVKDIIDSKEISVTCHLQKTRDWNVLFNQTLKVSSQKLNSFETFFFVNSYKLQTDDLISIHVTNIDSILYNSLKSTVFGVYKIS